MEKITNKQASAYVERTEEFRNGTEKLKTLYAKWESTCFDKAVYVVYSYGPHFPLYIYDPDCDVWCCNVDSYSVTTSRHKSQAAPRNIKVMTGLETEDMQQVIRKGFVGFAANARV